MVDKPVVIVFGARPGKPCGFPLGNTLLEKINNSLTPNAPTYDWCIKRITRPGISVSKLEEFRDKLFYSQQVSIDAFLELKPEYITIGKIMIALSLIPCEEDHRLFNFNARSKECYQYLFNKLTSETLFDKFGNNNLTIITFNYDRLLAYDLFSAMMRSYGKSFGKCAETVTELPVIHVYGSLGKLPWQSKNNDEIRIIDCYNNGNI